jgi:hypothetical protein
MSVRTLKEDQAIIDLGNGKKHLPPSEGRPRSRGLGRALIAIHAEQAVVDAHDQPDRAAITEPLHAARR